MAACYWLWQRRSTYAESLVVGSALIQIIFNFLEERERALYDNDDTVNGLY